LQKVCCLFKERSKFCISDIYYYSHLPHSIMANCMYTFVTDCSPYVLTCLHYKYYSVHCNVPRGVLPGLSCHSGEHVWCSWDKPPRLCTQHDSGGGLANVIDCRDCLGRVTQCTAAPMPFPLSLFAVLLSQEILSVTLLALFSFVHASLVMHMLLKTPCSGSFAHCSTFV